MEPLPDIPKANVNIAALKKRWGEMTYTKLFFEWKVAENRGDVWAAFAREAVEERRSGTHIGFWSIVRDSLRSGDNRRFDVDGGHAKCLWRKLTVPKANTEWIKIWLQIAALIVSVVSILYAAYRITR